MNSKNINISADVIDEMAEKLKADLASLESLKGKEEMLNTVDSMHSMFCSQCNDDYSVEICDYYDEGNDLLSWTKPAHQEWIKIAEQVQLPISNLNDLMAVIKSLSNN